MAYTIKFRRIKEKDRNYIIEHSNREQKEAYLKNIGIFKEKAIKEMSEKQLNEFVDVGLEVKGNKEWHIK